MAIRTVVAADSDGPGILRAGVCKEQVPGPEGSRVGSERQADPSNLTVRRSYQYLAGASSGRIAGLSDSSPLILELAG